MIYPSYNATGFDATVKELDRCAIQLLRCMYDDTPPITIAHVKQCLAEECPRKVHETLRDHYLHFRSYANYSQKNRITNIADKSKNMKKLIAGTGKFFIQMEEKINKEIAADPTSFDYSALIRRESLTRIALARLAMEYLSQDKLYQSPTT